MLKLKIFLKQENSVFLYNHIYNEREIEVELYKIYSMHLETWTILHLIVVCIALSNFFNIFSARKTFRLIQKL